MPPEIPSVLVVDDNPGDRYVIEYMLRKTGRFHQVYFAADGREALDLFERYEASRSDRPDRFPPVLLLLDINMPRLGGFEFLEHLRGLGLAELPTVILMLTSSTLADDSSRAAKDTLVSGYLVKPLSLEAAHGIADRYGRSAGSSRGTEE